VVIKRLVDRPPRELIEQLKTVDTATIGHLWETIPYAVIDWRIRPLDEKMKVVGPAVTARLPPIDNIVLHKAIDFAEPGDVLVISVGGDTKYACWGGLMSLSAKLKGIAGVVVDGAVCDIVEIKEIGLPVFTRAVTARTMIRKAVGGEVNVPITCGGTRIKPGDIVIGDDSGILVVPKGLGQKVLEAARAKKIREGEIIREMKAGRALSEILGVDDVLKRRGILR